MLFYVSYGAMWVLVIVLFCSVLLLYRHFGRQLLEQGRRLESGRPSIDEQVDVTLQAVDGKNVRIGGDVEDGHVVVFTAPGCKACTQLQPKLREAATNGKLRGGELLVIHHGNVESTKAYVDGMPANTVAVSDPGRDLARLWKVRWTPYFVVTGPGVVVRGKGMSLREAEPAHAVATGWRAAEDSTRPSRDSEVVMRQLAGQRK